MSGILFIKVPRYRNLLSPGPHLHTLVEESEQTLTLTVVNSERSSLPG